MDGMGKGTSPKFNSEFTPEKLPGPKKGKSSNYPFSGARLNFGGVPS